MEWPALLTPPSLTSVGKVAPRRLDWERARMACLTGNTSLQPAKLLAALPQAGAAGDMAAQIQ